MLHPDVVATTEPNGTGCTWSFTDKDSQIPGLGGTVTARVEGNDTGLKGPKLAFPGGEDVAIGDRGYWSDNLSVLYFVKGSNVYAVQLVLFNKADPRKDIAVKVAQLALSRI